MGTTGRRASCDRSRSYGELTLQESEAEMLVARHQVKIEFCVP